MLTIDNAVSADFPGAKTGVLAMKNIRAASPLAPSAVTQAMDEIHRRYGHLDRAGLKELHPVRAYVAYYKKFGYSYHVLAQLESVLQGKKQLRAESGLLQAMFLTELESMLLTAGHDLGKLRMPVTLSVSAGKEAYQSISGKETTAVQGDLMVCDGGGVISSILRGPDFGSRITESTAGVLFTLYAPPGIDAAYIRDALETLENRIRSFSPDADTALSYVYES
jgi:DNA/RNA-binding domain of Phe-tRNA-synthetase-like protein